jgi:hypothetical protein
MDMAPAARHAPAMIVLNQAQCGVMESNPSSARLFAKPVLNVGNDRIGHEQRTGNLQHGRPLDRLLPLRGPELQPAL